ncbi:MAG TPA: hypothetical protein VGO29_10770 [Solirubrobacteraceae bacterium]|jgi:hypothetical protein|nr:hypothetical protein [Solirubrobacteraceae bacterium]
MRPIVRGALAALLAVLALGAVASASASAAQPEFSSEFPNKYEVTKRGGNFEQAPVFVTVGKRKITCLSAAKTVVMSGKGELTGSKVATLALTFVSCSGFEGKCTTAGAKEGEIKTSELEAKPFYINKKQEVGVLLQVKGTGSFAEFNCGPEAKKETVKIRGSLVAPITPFNVSTTAFQLNIAGAGGVQKPTEYENEKAEAVKATLEVEGSGVTPFAFEQAELAGPAAELVTSKAATVLAQPASRGLPEFEAVQEGKKVSYPVAFEGKFVEETPRILLPDRVTSYGSAKVTGLIVGPNDVANVVMTFQEPGGLGAHCTNAPEHVLVTRALKGRLGYLHKSTKEAGLLLEPTVSPVAKCEGGAIAEEYIGSTIAKIAPGGELGTQLKLTFNDARETTKFEGEEVLHGLETIQNGAQPIIMGLGGRPLIGKTNNLGSLSLKA